MEVLEIDSSKETNKFVSAKRHFIEIEPYFKGFFFMHNIETLADYVPLLFISFISFLITFLCYVFRIHVPDDFFYSCLLIFLFLLFFIIFILSRRIFNDLLLIHWYFIRIYMFKVCNTIMTRTSTSMCHRTPMKAIIA